MMPLPFKNQFRQPMATAALAFGFLFVFGSQNVHAASNWPFEIVSPNGGETYAVGDTLTTTVGSSSASSLCALMIYVNPRYGFGVPGATTQFRPQAVPVHKFVIPKFFIESADTGTGPFLDSTLAVSDSCQLMLFDYSLPDDNDMSDSFFSIIAAPIVITAWPTGSHSAGDQVTVKWRAADRIPGCSVDFSNDNGQTWVTITSQAITRQSASWGALSFAVPAGTVSTSQCKVRVSSSDASYQTISSGISAVVNESTGARSHRTVNIAATNHVLIISGYMGNSARIDIYDARGRLDRSLRGVHGSIITIPDAQLALGLHLIRVTAGSSSMSRSVFINR